MKLLIAIKSKIIIDSLIAVLPIHDIHICSTGTDALAMLETLRPEILLLELSLPGMDGLTLLQKSHYKPKYILALTNLATPVVVQAAVDAGVQDMILIPCTIRCITEHLNALIEKAPSAEN